jgi:hypothetical protein
MTVEEVLTAEAAKPISRSAIEGETIIRYASPNVAGLTTQVVYIFVGNKLVRGKYIFDQEHAELNDFVQDYQTIGSLLRNAYGSPEKGEAIWEDDSTQQERLGYLRQDRATPDAILPSDRGVGLAVSLGHLKIYTQWATADTKITHSLAGANLRISHQVEYQSIKLQALKDEPAQRLPKTQR